MKKIFLLLMLFASSLAGCNMQKSDESANLTRAGIISETFVKQALTNSEEVDFKGDVRGEDMGLGKFLVYQQFTTKNDFGVKKLYVYKILMNYISGDWSDAQNWKYESLLIEDVATGKQFNL